MKGKKYIIGGIIIIAIIVFTIVFIIKIKNGDIFTPKGTDNGVVQKEEDFIPQGDLQTTLKSTKGSPIKEGDVEAQSIKIYREGENIQIITTLKNNSNSAVKGFFIMLSIYDANGKEITPFAVNKPEAVIPAKGTYQIKNSATIPENQTAVSAKITKLEINTAE